MVTVVIGDFVGQVSRGLQLIKINSFLVAGRDELMTAISLDYRVATTESSESHALEHRQRLSKEELLHKHASSINLY